MNDTIFYICKYAPIEICEGFGFKTEKLDPAPLSFECAESCMHPNICGFGKAVIEEVTKRDIRALLLTDCCDVCRRIYDVLKNRGGMDFLFLMALPHKNGETEVSRLSSELMRLKSELENYAKNCSFNEEAALRSLTENKTAAKAMTVKGPHVSLTGAHGGSVLKELLSERLPVPVQDDTCSGRRILKYETAEWDIRKYASALLNQERACMRMQFAEGSVPDNENIGTICHSMKFCDYYGFTYRKLRAEAGKLLKIETDSTPQSSGQLRTRIDAFAESLGIRETMKTEKNIRYAAGIDSGSASTDAVIMDADKKILGKAILPTGSGASKGAEKALEMALDDAGLKKSDIDVIVTTGYGRETIGLSDGSITEISCHAKGAHFLVPEVRTVIDIGGQDSKVIRLDEKGNVINFVMNDKCAAGTGRFLETMAKTLELSLSEMSEIGLKWKNEVAISSMCTVFAESEVVSLVAENTATEDIIHGLNESVANKTAALVKRLGGEAEYVMTGGVAQNKGVVNALEGKLGCSINVPEYAQLCGAIGAALFALDEK